MRMIIILVRAVHGSDWLGFVPNSDSTRSGRVGENQTRNRLSITMGRVGSGSKKRLVGSVETDERRQRAKEDEISSDLVGGVDTLFCNLHLTSHGG